MEVMDVGYGMKHCSSNKMVDELLEIMDGDCKYGAVISSRSKINGMLLEVSRWR